MVVGDFNLPKFTWVDCKPSIRPDCSPSPIYDNFVELLDDFNLTQIVTEPTRLDNILDLILTSNPTGWVRMRTFVTLPVFRNLFWLFSLHLG